MAIQDRADTAAGGTRCAEPPAHRPASDFRLSRRGFLAGLALLPWAPLLAGASEEAAQTHVFGALPDPARVNRVIAAGSPAAVLAYCLAPGKLLGWPMELSAEARALLALGMRDKPLLGRLAGRGSTMPLEKLLSLKPDLILDAGTVDATYRATAEQVFARTGIPYVLVEGPLRDTPRQLREAGRLLGVSERGETLAQYAASALPTGGCAEPGSRPKVYLARGADGLETTLPGSVNGESIEAACGMNAAAAGSTGSLARVSLEQILAWAPDVVVTQSPAFFAHAQQDTLWQQIPAIRNKRLLLAPSLPFGWLDGPPGVNRVAGVQWLHTQLHQEGEPEGWLARALEFHELFYGHRPAPAALMQQMGVA